MENEINEMFMDIDIDAGTVISTFVPKESVDGLIPVVKSIVLNGKDEHDANCASDDQCQGDIPYILKHMKAHLINHPEHTELERMAIAANVFYIAGQQAEEAMRMQGIGRSAMKGLPSPDEMLRAIRRMMKDKDN